MSKLSLDLQKKVALICRQPTTNLVCLDDICEKRKTVPDLYYNKALEAGEANIQECPSVYKQYTKIVVISHMKRVIHSSLQTADTLRVISICELYINFFPADGGGL